MTTFYKNYLIAKKKSIAYMQKGQLSSYLEALLEMKKYKRLMLAVIAN
jgi:hypothetical protein